ncbi:MAG TPA: hypothetical protein VM369_04235 [Candidatus Binatia bacterium]|nr:hypothetical protein [Candidatus Binatia bacterium]
MTPILRALLATLLPCSLAVAAAPAAPRAAETTHLDALAARFAPVDLKVDLSALPAGERRSLALQVRAAQVMDAVFLRQVSAGNEALLARLAAYGSSVGRARLANFLLHKGPWDRLEHDAPMFAGVPAKPEGGNFYPADATRDEIERWIATLAPDAAAQARGFFHTVRRAAGGTLMTVPYSLEYQPELALAAGWLRQAAEATQQPTLRKFLESRAAAFASNDYYASDVAWMELDASLEPTLGPYEVYEDGWFNYKAAFEAFIAVRDDAETARLAKFSAQLQDIEDHLPIDPALRNPKLGALAPIRVVNLVFAAGDGNRGVQTAAYNLPNDERVIAEKGSKRVMLRNVQQAKFERVLRPISRVALGAADQKHVAFEPFFTHILMHELVHGLGPHRVTGSSTTARQALKEASGPLEEARADVGGLWALQYLVDRGVLDRGLQDSMYDTFLASAFRTLRFGTGEAHGKGMALQLNWLLDHGGVVVRPDGRFAVVPSKIREAVTSLASEIMRIQAAGDYDGARRLLDTLGVVRPAAQRVIERLRSVPVDIAPRFVTAEALLKD